MQRHPKDRTSCSNCRSKTLKCLHSRPVLILICILVIVECICVLAELMVDLQAIRFRFENEETELVNFVDFLKKAYPDEFKSFKDRTFEELFLKLKDGMVLHHLQDNCTCENPADSSNRRKRDINDSFRREYFKKRKTATEGTATSPDDAVYVTPASPEDAVYVTPTSPEDAVHVTPTSPDDAVHVTPTSPPDAVYVTPASPEDAVYETSTSPETEASMTEDGAARSATSCRSSRKGNGDKRTRRRKRPREKKRKKRNGSAFTDRDNATEPAIFILHVNSKTEHFYLVGHYASSINESFQYARDSRNFKDKYAELHHISQGIHISSIVILFIMVVETFIKLCCMRRKFFKRKFEVFDAFIVIASFALDFVFLDSQWYETGKDASTILVLLLPWRVVRIVNSFLMTVNRKHHIEIMTVRKAKKKADIKISKLQMLVNEIKRDVGLLVTLCRSRGAPEHEITACLYGRGRRGVTTSAISSFASLMLISTLGKNTTSPDEDIYNKVLQEAMDEGQEETETGEEAAQETVEMNREDELAEEEEEDDDDEEEEEEEDEEAEDGDDDDDDDESSSMSEIDENLNCRGKRLHHSYPRRNTIPQRVGVTGQTNMIYYINNGYALHEYEDADMIARRMSMRSAASVQSLPGLSTVGGQPHLIVEMTSKMTHL